MRSLYAEIMWRGLAFVHLILIIFHVIAFFTLIFLTFTGEVVWYISLPCCTWIFYTGAVRVPCPFTNFENYYREKAGYRKVTGWFGHYLLKLPQQLLGLIPWDPPYDETDSSGISDALLHDGGRGAMDAVSSEAHRPQ